MTLSLMEQTTFLDNLARNIWKRRKALHLTQEMLSEKIDLTPQHIYLIENGKVMNPGIITIMTFARFFGCSVSDLLEDNKEEVTQ